MSEETVGVDEAHYVTTTAEIDEGERAIIEVEGREIAVFAIDGEYFGVANFCTHQGGPVCEGMLAGAFVADEDGQLRYDREGQIVSCPWHGWEFDVKTGRHLASERYRLPTYDVIEQDGELYVRL